MLTHEERLKIYDEATKLWGLVAQYDQCVEEMAEMIVAINKYKRKVLYKEYQNDDKVIKNLVEEIADVCKKDKVPAMSIQGKGAQVVNDVFLQVISYL